MVEGLISTTWNSLCEHAAEDHRQTITTKDFKALARDLHRINTLNDRYNSRA